MSLIFVLFFGLQWHTNDDLLQNIMVVVVLTRLPFPFGKVLLQLEVYSECLCLYLVETRQEVLTDMLVIVVERLEHQDARNHQEHISITALQ